MNRDEYLKQLRSYLNNMPLDEVDNVMEYYFEYFSEAGVENEQDIIKELGAPQELAKKIYSDYNAMNGNENSNQQYQNGYNTTQNNGNQNNNAYQSGFYNNNYYNNTAYSTYKAPKKSIGLKIALIIMTVLASPIWLGIVVAILGVAVSVVIAVVAVAFSIGVVGVTLIGSGLFIFVLSFKAIIQLGIITGLHVMGVALLAIGFGLLIAIGFVEVVILCVKLLKFIFVKVKDMIIRRKERHSYEKNN